MLNAKCCTRRPNLWKLNYSVKACNPLRGTKDFYGPELDKYAYMVNTTRKVASLYGYEEIATPVLEEASLFLRNLGASSDVVTKEMYIFEDKSKDLVALRPENTAGVVRAFISNRMTASQACPLNLFYHGPMFRHERPQKGRLRQFHQIGIESLGDAHPLCDVFQIAFAYDLLSEWGIPEVNLELNTLGDSESKKNYSVILEEYFKEFSSQLSPDSQQRLNRGSVLRILDSKSEIDAKFITGAPKYFDYLNAESKERWLEVLSGLDSLNLKYSINNRLVRGLDYYTHTCFEFTSSSPNLGAQSAILAGGRYDDLVHSMGGGIVPGCGWALGVERILLLLNHEKPATPNVIAVLPILEDSKEDSRTILQACARLCHQIRRFGLPVQFFNPSVRAGKHSSISTLLSLANKNKCTFAAIIGLNEINTNTLILKNLSRHTQSTYVMDTFESQLPILISTE